MSISCGAYHTLFLATNGSVLFVGSMFKIKTSTPKLLSKMVNIVFIIAGDSKSICLDEMGAMWVLGSNNHSELGIKDKSFIISPTRILFPNVTLIEASIGDSHCSLLDKSGFVWSIGEFFSQKHEKPTRIENLQNIISISSKRDNTFCLDSSGNVWSFCRTARCSNKCPKGNNNNVIKINGLNNITQLASGYSLVLFLDNNDTVWSIGEIDNPYLCTTHYEEIKHVKDNIKKIFAGHCHFACLNDEGQIFMFGRNSDYCLGFHHDDLVITPTLLPFSNRIIDASLGLSSSILLGENNQLWAFGSNRNGKLGICQSSDFVVGPIQIPVNVNSLVFISKNKSARK